MAFNTRITRPTKKKTALKDLTTPINKNTLKQPKINLSKEEGAPTQYENIEFLPTGRVRRTNNRGEQTEFSREEWETFKDAEKAGFDPNIKTKNESINKAMKSGREDLLKRGIAQPNAREQLAQAQKIDAEIAAIEEQLKLSRMNLSPTNPDINILPDLAAGAGQTIAAGAAGAALGAGAGLATAGTASAPLAVIGGVGAAGVKGLNVVGELKEEYRQETKVNVKEITQGETTLIKIINAANSGTISKEQALADYQETMLKIDQAEANLKKLEEKDWLTKARPELVRFQQFNDARRGIYDAKMARALVTPEPTQILSENVTPEE